jgi:IS30 family transposase
VPKTHNHLNLEERALMQVMLDRSCSLRAIARKLQSQRLDHLARTRA